MIDDVATRAALSVAAFVLLATGASVVQLAPRGTAHEAAHELALHIARQLEAIGSTEAEFRLRGESPASGVFSLPTDVAGASYRVEVRATDVRVSSHGHLAAAPLRVRVHPFPPDREAYSSTQLETLDAAVTIFHAGQPFVVERTQKLVDGTSAFLTFVYLPH